MGGLWEGLLMLAAGWGTGGGAQAEAFQTLDFLTLETSCLVLPSSRAKAHHPAETAKPALSGDGFQGQEWERGLPREPRHRTTWLHTRLGGRAHQVQTLETGSGWGSPRWGLKARWDAGGTVGLDAYLGQGC